MQGGMGPEKDRLRWFLIYLTAGTILCLPLYRRRFYLIILMLVDYFAILMLGYVDKRYAFVEYLWMPGIIAAISLVMPNPLALLLPAILGIPGCIFFSHRYFSGAGVSLGEGIVYPYPTAAFFFYVPVTLLSVAAGCLHLRAGKIKKEKEQLELLNLQLLKINKDVTRKMFRLQNDTTLEERRRISKEIHDTAGYMFANLIMMLQAASAVLGKDVKEAERIIKEARDYAERGINEIRYILRNIRESHQVFLSMQNTLFDISESFRKATDITLTIEYGNWPRTFSKPINSFFTSFIQECLTNALKHGHATAITIMCWTIGARIFMRIADNGRGAVMPIKKGIGISAMEEFAILYDGNISIQSSETGFMITAELNAGWGKKEP
jgi:signal transduction histidine kinase